MYARSTGDRELTFDLAEGLLEDNLLIVDRETSSAWSLAQQVAAKLLEDNQPSLLGPWLIDHAWIRWLPGMAALYGDAAPFR